LKSFARCRRSDYCTYILQSIILFIEVAYWGATMARVLFTSGKDPKKILASDFPGRHSAWSIGDSKRPRHQLFTYPRKEFWTCGTRRSISVWGSSALSFGLQAVIAAHWAAANEQSEGWCYCIYLENEPWAGEGNRNMTSEAGKWSMDYQGEILLRPNGGLKLGPEHIWGARKSVRASQSYRSIQKKVKQYDGKGVPQMVTKQVWVKGFEQQGELELVGSLHRNPRYRGPDLMVLAANEPEFQAFLGRRRFILPPG
jgi:hypothetical protein